MGQDTCQMGKVSLVYCKKSLLTDGFVQAIKHALVEVSGLVIHSRHDGI